jgi:hypothetical protein
MQMTGHKTRSVFERCNIVSDCDLVEAAKKLNAFQRVPPSEVRLKPDTTYGEIPTKVRSRTRACPAEATERRRRAQFGAQSSPIAVHTEEQMASAYSYARSSS